jgi:hypothetical protein
MMLTSYGDTLRPDAELLLAEWKNAMHEVDKLRGLEKGMVKIAAVARAVADILPLMDFVKPVSSAHNPNPDRKTLICRSNFGRSYETSAIRQSPCR